MAQNIVLTAVSPSQDGTGKQPHLSDSASPDNSSDGSPRQTGTSAPDSGPESDPSNDLPEETQSNSDRPPLVSSASAPGAQHDSYDEEEGNTTVREAVTRTSSQTRPPAPPGVARRSSFGLGFLSSISNTIRGTSSTSSAPQTPGQTDTPHHFMSNSPTIANLSNFANGDINGDSTVQRHSNPHPLHTHSHSSHQPEPIDAAIPVSEPPTSPLANAVSSPGEMTATEAPDHPQLTSEGNVTETNAADQEREESGRDKDGSFSIRVTPIIDHSSSNAGLYFAPIIRRSQPKEPIAIGRYTEKHRSAAHAPQGSSSRIVFKSKVVSRSHALFQCNEEGQWFLKDCKSSSGTFLNNIRLSQASQESTLWPLTDGDVVQLGLDYRGGAEEVYRCVKMRCEFNRSWQRKVNRFNIDIHKKMKNLSLEEKNEELSECAICLLKLEPCQAIFVSPCSHTWHYKCIRPLIIKRYPQFYCPNCRSVCDLETDIEDEE